MKEMKLKLTPHGKRFADVIKRELADPDSYISEINRKFSAYKRLEKEGSLTLKIGLMGNIVVKEKDATISQVSYISDVSIWYPVKEDNV